ncbi:paeninodin family lasso peptide [Gorillibacterium massiliense]|nr:paeninodin family lasso peptide [Gorillibacterium massiliense]
MSKKEWIQPSLEELSIKMTLQGSASTEIDATFSDVNETVHLHGS